MCTTLGKGRLAQENYTVFPLRFEAALDQAAASETELEPKDGGGKGLEWQIASAKEILYEKRIELKPFW